MKTSNQFSIISILLIVVVVFFSFYNQTPHVGEKALLNNGFSTDRALDQLNSIARKPHYVGTREHTKVREYVVKELEKLGLEVHIQEQEAVNSKWKGGAKTYNILTRIKGTGSDKAIMLLSHYDSTPHSSFGGSDAGSGVVTILETLRVYLASGEKPKNDIIILISDAEELGLLGAKAFVNHHPWAKDVGLVVNLEARGSGGPSYMLLETNGGNHQFIKEFNKANTSNPVGNSLMYSIYKMLPNDTDLTVFREDGDIDGFNFAFIDDFYDYHTAQDTKERLDKNTLAHQGSYTLTLLNYFSNHDLSKLKGQSDDVFFNFPFFGVVYYPFTAVIPMIGVISLIFIIFFIVGVRNKKLSIKHSLLSFIPFLLSLIAALIIGFAGWKTVLFLHPQYLDILQGFPYNGHVYLIAFITLTMAVTFWIYKAHFKSKKIVDLMFAPLVFWIVINFLIGFKLKGGGFFIIPLIGMLISWMVLLFSNDTKKILFFAFLGLPTLIIFSPLLKMFPVGLGMATIGISLVLLVLVFGSLLAVFGLYSNTKFLIRILLGISLIAFITASFKSGYTKDRRQPNSMIFIQDTDKKEAYFASYNKQNDSYTKQFLGENPQKGGLATFFSNKFKTKLNLHTKTAIKNIPEPIISKQINDTLYKNKTHIDYVIKPQRDVNLLYITAKDTIDFYDIKFNGEAFSKQKEEDEFVFSTTAEDSKIISYYLAKGVDSLHISMELPNNQQPSFELYEVSFDLLDNPLFSIEPRNDIMMPTPFIINDAIILKKDF